uniref:Uncharacterized protein n=1 Tax=viral metagenome TaxID=1070528 RepID=A0A6H1ZB29_9ZZZZ
MGSKLRWYWGEDEQGDPLLFIQQYNLPTHGPRDIAIMQLDSSEDDAAEALANKIVHACNAYPEQAARIAALETALQEVARIRKEMRREACARPHGSDVAFALTEYSRELGAAVAVLKEPKP